ncbi:MAG TPA: RNB domain-containing ribonuclease [Myxococcota bacterium]|jgi:exoribonuclease-2|nr:RNB domain-containing ribonuclease [Myxococcota bacterium]
MLGTLVELRDRGKIVLGTVVKADGEKLVVLTQQGRKLSTSREKVLHASGEPAGRDAQAAMRRFAERVAEAAAQVDLAQLWDLCADERDGPLDLAALAALHFNAPDSAQRSALLHALEQDTLFFRARGEAFAPRSRDEVEAVRVARRRESDAESARAAAAEWLARGGQGDMPEGARRHVELLADFAAHGDAWDKAPAARAVAARALPGTPPERVTPAEVLKVLVGAGVIGPHENLLLRRHGWPRAFAAETLEAAARAAAAPAPDPCAAVRRPWPGTAAVAVDDPTTREVDDALELCGRAPGGGWRVAVHIADPSRFFAPGDPLDREAQRRMTTLYLPDERWPMLPPPLAFGAASLVAGDARPAVTFLFTVDPDGALGGVEVVAATLTLGRRLSYEEADAGCAAEPDGPLAALLAAADALRARRGLAGGVTVSAPEVAPRVTFDAAGTPQVALERFDPGAPGRRLVAELMVAANMAAAGALLRAGVPALYRVQREEAPASGGGDAALAAAPRTPQEVGAAYDPLAMARSALPLGRAESSLKPGRHAGLGVDQYLQVTSPIRRYLDLVAHRQLKALAAGVAAPYDPAALTDIGRRADERASAARAIETAGNEYWLLFWFGQHVGTEATAVVLQEQEDRVKVELLEFGYRTTMRLHRRAGPGARVPVVVKGADPRAGRVFLKERA